MNKTVKNNSHPQSIAVKLTSRGEQFVVRGHPWVFSNSIVKVSNNPQTGDIAIIFSKNKNKLIAIGLYDSNSPIRIKIIHHGKNRVKINTKFFHQKIQLAFEKRTDLLKTNTNSYRLLFGENDSFPGLIADVYDKLLVIKLYSEIWLS